MMKPSRTLSSNWAIRAGQALVIALIGTALPCVTLIPSISAQSVPAMMDNTPGAYWNRDDCAGFRFVFEKVFTLMDFTREKALRRASEVQTKDPDWKKYLPCCPEVITLALRSDWTEANTWPGIPEKIFDSDVPQEARAWIEKHLRAGEKLLDADLLDCYHLNAASCIRSKDFSGLDRHGQQCCYNNRGELIRSGLGAGTPDYYSPQKLLLHWKYDTWTWTKLSHNEYQAIWTPNQGCNSPFRVRVGGPTDWTYSGLWVKKGDVIRFSDAKGTVVWGVNGSSSGPAEIKVIKESLFSFAEDLPKIIAPPGSLIAMIYLGEIEEKENIRLAANLQTKPLFIGNGGDMEVFEDGLLFLGVNDQNPANNSGYFDVELRRIKSTLR